MSRWWPGSRWTPGRYGIGAGIADTAAGGGVSDQIRRLMQSSAPARPPIQQGDARYTQGPSIPMTGGFATWTVPEAAVAGLSVAVYSVSVDGVSGGTWGRLDVQGTTPTGPIVSGATALQLVYLPGPFPLSASTDGTGAMATFSVLAW